MRGTVTRLSWLCSILAWLGAGALALAQQEDRALQLLLQARQLEQRLSACCRQQKMPEAEQLARQVVALREQLPDQQLQLAGALATLGQLLARRGERTEAVAALERALALQESTLGKEHPAVARLLDSLASLRQAAGELQTALPLFERALAIRRKRPGFADPELAQSLNHLASLLHELGNPQRAQDLAREALALDEKRFGKDAPAVAADLTNLAVLLSAQGNLTGARPLLERSLELRSQAGEAGVPGMARTLESLGTLYRDEGDLQAARDLYEGALTIRQDLLGRAHPDVAESLADLGTVLQAQGDFELAQERFESALGIWEATLGPRHPTVATGLNNLAALLQARGELPAARRLLERSLAIYEEALGKDSPSAATASLNLARLVELQGDRAAARPLLERSLGIYERTLGKDHLEVATALNNLAYLLHDEGELPAARDLFERALRIYETRLGANHPSVATALNNLAALRQEQGDLAGALPLFGRALAILTRSLGADHPDVAAVLSRMGLLARASGDFLAARDSLNRALAIRERLLGAEHLEVGKSLRYLALLEAPRAPHTAFGLAARALAIRASAAGKLLPGLADWERLAFLADSRRYLDLFLALAAGPAEDAAAYDAVLFWKGLAWRMLAASSAATAATTDPVRAASARELSRCRTELARTFLQSPEAAGALQRREALARLTARKEALERQLGGGEAERLVPSRPVVSSQVLAALPAGSGLVDYVVYERETGPLSPTERRLAAFVSKPGLHAPQRVELGALSKVEPLLRAWNRSLSTGVTGASQAQTRGRKVAARLWEPVAARLGACNRVFLCPDGPLCRLPFAALPGPVEGTYLAEQLSLALVTAGEDLGQLDEPGSSSSGLLAIGGLLFDRGAGPPRAESAGQFPASTGTSPGAASSAEGADAGTDCAGLPGGAFPPLPGAALEVSAVTTLFRGAFRDTPPAAVCLLEGTAARKDVLAAAVRGRRFVHLATHGYWNPCGPSSAAFERPTTFELALLDRSQVPVRRNPLLFAGLALSGANLGREGLLSGEEAATLPLRGVELVTLSACESGTGQVVTGEGVLGLRRALMAAGARQVLSALWQVPDEQTLALMTSFYEGYWKRKLPAMDALAAAQRALLARERASGAGAGPLGWAGFVLTVRGR
jgi:CHAT domain-containing protein/tetratricopeptide (TPR) repeat protein